jgi:hypothetical protein
MSVWLVVRMLVPVAAQSTRMFPDVVPVTCTVGVALFPLLTQELTLTDPVPQVGVESGVEVSFPVKLTAPPIHELRALDVTVKRSALEPVAGLKSRHRETTTALPVS